MRAVTKQTKLGEISPEINDVILTKIKEPTLLHNLPPEIFNRNFYDSIRKREPNYGFKHPQDSPMAEFKAFEGWMITERDKELDPVQSSIIRSIFDTMAMSLSVDMTAKHNEAYMGMRATSIGTVTITPNYGNIRHVGPFCLSEKTPDLTIVLPIDTNDEIFVPECPHLSVKIKSNSVRGLGLSGAIAIPMSWGSYGISGSTAESIGTRSSHNHWKRESQGFLIILKLRVKSIYEGYLAEKKKQQESKNKKLLPLEAPEKPLVELIPDKQNKILEDEKDA